MIRRTKRQALFRFLCAALVLIGCEASGAEEVRTPLPLAAPANTPPLVEDFIEVCSLAMTRFEEAGSVAVRRGWKNPGEDDPFAIAAMVAFGNITLAKRAGEGPEWLLLIQRSAFPHLVSTSCILQTLGSEPVSLDLRPLSALPGIKGGMLLIAGEAGRWSFLADNGEPVTIASYPLGERGFTVTMATAKRVTPP